MEESALALYPFVPQAATYVQEMGFSLERLIESRAFEAARKRGQERVIQSINGIIEKPSLTSSDEGKVLTELLSYPYARILVSCFNDPYLTRKYAHAEAEAAHSTLKKEDNSFLREFGAEFEINAIFEDNAAQMHFTDFLKYATTLKALEWKLINQRIEHGQVFIPREGFNRLLQEAVKKHILGSLPLKVPEAICTTCTPQLTEIREVLQEKKGDYDGNEFGEVSVEQFPPCIKYAIANVRGGINLAHSMRFAMTSFLLAAGMTVDEIIDLFNVSPDFDEEKTRYQIEHIAGSSGDQYTPPSCSTMKTYGNCHGADDLCKRINHPLNYYRRKMWFMKQRNRSSEKKEEVVKDSGDGKTEE
ncbi:DNA primase large subunit [Methanohalophilus levihalophilus]|uniref:DNA primase regulatory subunit PriL n=1 Tax=Methanohalophilus levihalophilus TaxID=1431282 RepID=UPI001AEA8291|nr:DNA primase regulatory subunit PriL [Methanohalophilus levihalophilus]MBP2030266.1 DNA primase large subunit [Methanohalophilus levihalophilus]